MTIPADSAHTLPSALAGVVTAAADELGVPGVSWATDDGRSLTTGQTGSRTRGSIDPIDQQTRFQACSVSKPVAVLGMLELVARGDLDLDEEVGRWLKRSDLIERFPVTLRELASHTAGLSVSGVPGYDPAGAVPDLEQILDGVAPATTPAVRLMPAWRSRFQYSGGGFTVIQAVVEAVTGSPFAETVHDLVLTPLGMDRSHYGDPRVWDDNWARGYETGIPDAGFRLYPEKAAAGLWTTPVDLVRLVSAVSAAWSTPELRLAHPVRRESAHAMLDARQPSAPRVGGLDSIGLGFFLGGRDSAFRFGHAGGNVGYRCHVLAWPTSGQATAIMTNGQYGDYLCQWLLLAVANVLAWPDYPRDVDDPR